ncbi:unnamed protein product, partial [Brassica rapa subsp. trilocularis]
SQAQEGLLSLLILPSPFPWLWFRWIVDRDILSWLFDARERSRMSRSQSFPRPTRGGPLLPR